jgi:hypothetical protein
MFNAVILPPLIETPAIKMAISSTAGSIQRLVAIAHQLADSLSIGRVRTFHSADSAQCHQKLDHKNAE